METPLHIVVLLAIATSVLFLIDIFSKRKAFPSQTLRHYPLVGHLPHFVTNRHRFLEWIAEVLALSPTQTITLFTPTTTSTVITANPSNIEHILKTSFNNYPKGSKIISVLHDFLGNGIFNSDGENWRWQRKVASYEFSTRSLRSYVMNTIQNEIISRLIPLLSRATKKGEAVDLQDVFERFGFDSICKVSFGEDASCLTEKMVEAAATKAAGDFELAPDFFSAFGEAQDLITVRLFSPADWMWKVKKLLNIGCERRLKVVNSVVHGYADGIIKSRKTSTIEVRRDDLLSRIASSRECFTEEQLREMVISIITAGRDTTSSALTWFFWIVSSREDVERRILGEIRSVRSNNPGQATFSFEELQEMHFLHAAVSESMRLYPPVPFDKVSCKEQDTLPDGTLVGKGWFVGYSAYSMGRSESIWGKDCREYRPERWLDEEGQFKPENPYRYPVFHAGPKMCLGKEMAYLQMKSVAAYMLERFKIEVVGAGVEEPEYALSFTLRMKGGLLVHTKERNEDAIVA